MNSAVGLTLSALDARVLRATDAWYERSPEKIGELAGCAADVALSALRRLRVAYLWRTTASVRSGGFVPTAAMSHWSISRERWRGRNAGPVSESLTGWPLRSSAS